LLRVLHQTKYVNVAGHPNPLGLDRVPPEHAISTLPVQRIGKLQNCRFINSFRMMKTGEEEETQLP
jgi:hypothetical protein